MKGAITVFDPRLHPDTNRDMRAMYDANTYSPNRCATLDYKRRNELRACLGMDQDTLTEFFARFHLVMNGTVSLQLTARDCHKVAESAKPAEYWIMKRDGHPMDFSHWYRRDNGTYGEIV